MGIMVDNLKKMFAVSISCELGKDTKLLFDHDKVCLQTAARNVESFGSKLGFSYYFIDIYC